MDYCGEEMSVEIFSKEEFENALPSKDGQPLWVCLGVIQKEHCYQIEITPDIFIHIRSSIGINGYSANTGEDSIRAWLVDSNSKPLGSKVSKWTTRLPGWQDRMLDVLQTLWNWAYQAGYCKECLIPMSVYKVKKKQSKYYGKVFCKCSRCGGGWKILDD